MTRRGKKSRRRRGRSSTPVADQLRDKLREMLPEEIAKLGGKMKVAQAIRRQIEESRARSVQTSVEKLAAHLKRRNAEPDGAGDGVTETGT